MNTSIVESPGLFAIALAVVFASKVIASAIRQSFESVQCCLKHRVEEANGFQDDKRGEDEQVKGKVADHALERSVREIA